jgi:hypothetical protein
VHQWGHQLAVDDGLDLLLGACSDVGDGPARLLLDRLLVVGGQQVEQAVEGAAVDDDLQEEQRTRTGVSARQATHAGLGSHKHPAVCYARLHWNNHVFWQCGWLQGKHHS